MVVTSKAAKQRWNNANYVQLKVSVRPEIAAAFKAKCLDANVSMASEISRFMSGQINESRPVKPSSDPYATRQKRRKALCYLINQLKAIMYAENRYLGNIPENLQNSMFYEAAEHSVSSFEEALDILDGAYWYQ